MRFIDGGPNLPDELLLALDEGRVVFFCGAGVSRARANLPDFFGLADQVLQRLGVPDSSAAAKILSEARDLESRTGVPGLISADRIFGLLERDFLERDIERAVAKALKPKKGVDLWAHKLLLDLATTKDGNTKLVTTNFDRLFDDCGRRLDASQPPRLPDPARPGDLQGIVYLHGRATQEYDGSEGDGFILSSAEFGRAYLAEGWATKFFKEVIDRYVVVFIGYTADDPPVQYLLEALNKSNGRLSDVYAFQSGDGEEASARWQHKGVTAIPYESKDGHSALWGTLDEWSKRAKDPEAWKTRTIELSQCGPECLSPIEREQVAHLVSTKEGARKFFESDPPAPATWLCVFDKTIRYARPEKILYGEDEGKLVDPFTSYGLAGDPVPMPTNPDDFSLKRDMPTDEWDAFSFNGRDRSELRDRHITPLRGGASLIAGALPDRMNHLGSWLGKVSNQNAAVWWAARQHGLHVGIQQRIRRNLERSGTACAPHILQAWHYLFDHWQADNDVFRLDWYRFADEIKSVGWNKTTVRKYEMLSRPRMSASHNYFRDAVPPQKDEETDLGRLLKLDVVFNEDTPQIDIPDDWLADVVAARKRNLDIAIQLETERGYYKWLDIPPIIASSEPGISDHARTEGVTGAVLSYAAVFERLLRLDSEKARREAATWPDDDDNIFARMRIWASRFENLVKNEQFSDFFSKVSQEAFWEIHHQRDLLLVLKERWATLPNSATRQVEERILAGRDRWTNEARHDFGERQAWAIADRLHWLRSNGCTLNIDYNTEIQRLKNAAPKWKPKDAENADRSWEGRGGSVRVETEHTQLLSEPLSNVLAKAQELAGRTDDFLVERDPFGGLCQSHPTMAVSALRFEAKRGQLPEWAWRRFLNSDRRKNDKERLKRFIADLLVSARVSELKDIIYPAADWLLNVSEDLSDECVPTFERFAKRLLVVLNENPSVGGSGIVRGSRDPDWATEALNSPAGKIMQALYHDPRRQDLEADQGLPNDWRELVESTLALPVNNGRFSLVFCTYLLNWFYSVDPVWTEEHLLSVLSKNDTDSQEAWWTGYLWGARNLPSFQLFQIIKPHLLAKASSQTYEERDDHEKLAGLVLASWGRSDLKTGAERISNDEFRKVLLDAGDRFRSRVLGQLERWGSEDSENGQFWRALQERFLRDVWPVQKVVRTPQSSARLVELAFSSEDTFMAVSEAILPLLSPIERDRVILPSIRRGGGNIVDEYPARVLDILYLALPGNASNWPYKIDATLERVVVADPSLRSDARWIELMRRWNSRYE